MPNFPQRTLGEGLSLFYAVSRGQSDANRIQCFYCRGRLNAEVRGALNISVVQGGSKILAQQKSDSSSLETCLLAFDGQDSVMSLSSVVHPPQPILYSPYGSSEAAFGTQSLLGFNGERLDPVTRHYLLGDGYRAFNPKLMRFNSPDGMSPFNEGGLNSYAYCLGDPVNLKDPAGRFAVRNWFSKMLDWLAVKTGVSRAHNGPSQLFKSHSTTVETQVSSYQRPRSKSLSQPVKPPTVTDAKGWDLIGFHGSSSAHAPSLMSGLDPGKMGTHGLTMGSGFYASPTRSIPEIMARNSVIGRAGSPQVFGVYTQNQARLKPGRDFTFGVRGEVPRNRNHLEIVIHKEAYNLVVVRAADLRSDVSLPRAYEAPF